MEVNAYRNKLYNTVKGNLDQLKRVAKSSLSSDSGSGGALIPLPLRREIVNGIVYKNPFLREMNLIPIDDGNMRSKTYTYPKLNRLRRPGMFAAERSEGKYSNAQTEQVAINHKVRKARLKIWNFVEQVTAGQIDLVAMELDNEVRATALDTAISLIYDNPTLSSSATTTFGAWEHSFDTVIQQNRIQAFSAGLPVALDINILDEMIIAADIGGADPERSVIYMSPAMAVRLGSIVTPGTITYFNQLPNQALGQPYEVNAGLFIGSYKGFRIATNTMCGGKTAGENSVTYALSAIAGGTFAADTWNFKIAKVQIDVSSQISNLAIGESIASSGLPQVLSGVQGVRITIPTGDETTLYYKIYAAQGASATDADYRLIAVARGQTYNTDGDITGSITNTNTLSGLACTSDANGNVIQIDILQNTGSAALLRDQGVVSKMAEDLPLTKTSGMKSEFIMLLDHSRIRGMGDFVYINDQASEQTGFADINKVVPRGDYSEFLLTSYGTPVFGFDGSSVMVRGVRSA
jgi:hypothetical protein